MRELEIARFIEINKHFWSLEAVSYLVAYIHSFVTDLGVILHLGVSDNKVITPPHPSKFTDPLKSVHELHTKNGYSRAWIQFYTTSYYRVVAWFYSVILQSPWTEPSSRQPRPSSMSLHTTDINTVATKNVESNKLSCWPEKAIILNC
jgi:hypothetical protein